LAATLFLKEENKGLRVLGGHEFCGVDKLENRRLKSARFRLRDLIWSQKLDNRFDVRRICLPSPLKSCLTFIDTALFLQRFSQFARRYCVKRIEQYGGSKMFLCLRPLSLSCGRFSHFILLFRIGGSAQTDDGHGRPLAKTCSMQRNQSTVVNKSSKFAVSGQQNGKFTTRSALQL
jgi:hypothetical protein